jgi:ADP-ribose pyrophosphatase
MKARPPKAPPVPSHPLYLPEADEVVWDGRFPLQRVRFRYRRADGTPSGLLTWEMWRRGGGAVILPYDPWTRRIALVEQFRLPALAAGEHPLMRECPAGLLEPEEEAEATVRRELREEAGLTADKVEKIGHFMTMQGGADEVLHFFCGRVRLPDSLGARAMGLPEEQEETRLVLLPAEEAFAQLARNEIRNAPTALLLMWLQLNTDRLHREWMSE